MKIVYQGSPGAYSHLAAKKIYPEYEFIPYNTFEDCFKHCNENEEHKTIIPVENSIAGRVADIQYLINKYKLQIYAEHFQEIKHNLMILKNNELKNVKSVRSHSQAISQCQKLINSSQFEPIIAADTAGSAKYISEKKINLGKSLRYFGDGFQIAKVLGNKRLWRIPVMDGEFICVEFAY